MDTNRFEEDSRLLLDLEEGTNRPSKRGGGRWILFLLVLGGLSYAGYYTWGHWVKPAAADATNAQTAGTAGRDGKGGRGGRGGGRGGVGSRGAAVVTTVARKMDMPIYLRGLGTATAYNTVTVRSRVDGQLVHVAFREGQFVQQGDLLAEIDKRPFEVQLSQARGHWLATKRCFNRRKVNSRDRKSTRLNSSHRPKP